MIGRMEAARLGFLRREISAGVTAGLVALPICIASGVLAYAPLGLDNIAQGASAGLTGGAFAAIFAAIFSTSSFVISSPRASISIIQGTLAAWLLQKQGFAGHSSMIIDAMSLCGLLAGVWQMLFSLSGIERIIKCTPHPVLAGFINGVALLVIAQQFWQLLDLPPFAPGDGFWVDPGAVAKLTLALALAVFIVYLGAWSKKLPAMLLGLLLGIVVFHVAQAFSTALPLGPTISLKQVSYLPYTSLLTQQGRDAFLAIAPALLLSSLVLALVAALESLLAFRVAQNLSNVRADAGRDVFGQGVGNLVSALVGGIAAAASSTQLTANYEAGGRSRLSVLTAAALLLLVQALLTPVWTAIPAIAIWAVLLAIAVLLFDQWSLRMLRDLLLAPGRIIASGAWRQLAVAAVVTAITASGAVIGGVLVGIGLACVLFIADMSRSMVRRRYRGDEVFSKRMRSAADVSLLQQSGQRRAVIELQGVMFFANADELSREISELFRDVDMLALDMRAVTDIDVSAATILQHEAQRARRSGGKRLLFAGLLPELEEVLNDTETGGPLPPGSVFPDIDAALEWMEEEALQHEVRATPESVPLERHDLMRGLSAAELQLVARLLKQASFPAGAVVCREGERAAEMWILTRGSVSVRLLSAGRRTKRLASLGVGTIVGDMAFIEGSTRSATIVADEDVEGYVLDRDAYAAILRDHPEIGAKLLTNLLGENMRRLRNTSAELRAMSE